MRLTMLLSCRDRKSINRHRAGGGKDDHPIVDDEEAGSIV